MCNFSLELSLLPLGLVLSLWSSGCLGNEFIFCKFVAWAYVYSFVSRTNFNSSKLDHGQNKYTAQHLSCPTCTQIRNRSDPSREYQQATLLLSVAELTPISTSPRRASSYSQQATCWFMSPKATKPCNCSNPAPAPAPEGRVGTVLGLQKSLTQQLSLHKHVPSAYPMPGDTAMNKTGNPACMELTFQEVLRQTASKEPQALAPGCSPGSVGPCSWEQVWKEQEMVPSNSS